MEAEFAANDVSVNDRLTAMMFLVGLLHLILILGISFAPPAPDDSGVPTLEVLLVSDAAPESASNDEASYLAQRTQQGAGNQRRNEVTQLPRAAESAHDQSGEAEGDLSPQSPAGPTGGEASLLATREPGARYLADAKDPAAAAMPSLPRRLLAGDQAIIPASADDAELRLRGKAWRELLVTASTRESAVAGYLDAWRRRVEQIGTINFPDEARRRQLSGNPVVEVAVAASGRLLEVRVRRSSGHPELDQAAISILRLAAPFEPFPAALARRQDGLRFAYEWRFVAGRLTGSAVNVPAESR